MMGQAWRRLNERNLQHNTRQGVFIARRGDGKCCVGVIESFDDRSVKVVNGNHEVTLWFNEPRMFVVIEPPSPGEIRIAERELPLGK